MNIRETRRRRLEELIDEFGSLKAIADRAGLNPDWLSQIRTDHAGMGHQTARRLDDGCGKPKGWMDTPPESNGVPTSFARKWKRLTPAQQAAVTSMVDALLGDEAPAKCR